MDLTWSSEQFENLAPCLPSLSGSLSHLVEDLGTPRGYLVNHQNKQFLEAT